MNQSKSTIQKVNKMKNREFKDRNLTVIRDEAEGKRPPPAGLDPIIWDRKRGKARGKDGEPLGEEVNGGEVEVVWLVGILLASGGRRVVDGEAEGEEGGGEEASEVCDEGFERDEIFGCGWITGSEESVRWAGDVDGGDGVG